jgi:hypothetical protein
MVPDEALMSSPEGVAEKVPPFGFVRLTGTDDNEVQKGVPVYEMEDCNGAVVMVILVVAGLSVQP